MVYTYFSDKCTPIPIIGVHQPWKAETMGTGKYHAQSFYDECNTIQIKLKLNYKTDADVIKWLVRQKNSNNSSMQGAIKMLIRQQICIEQQNQSGR